MDIPSFIPDVWVVANGYLTDSASMYHDELNRSMQESLSNDGWTLPQLTPSQINSVAPDMPNGTMWYAIEADPPEAGSHEVVVKKNGSLVKLTTASWP